MNFFQHIGQYSSLMKTTFSKPDKGNVFWDAIVDEIEKIGIGSVGIVFFISFFFGAVISLQTAINMENPLLPDYLVGLGTRDSIMLEFSSTVMCLILSGKVGSNIASEIGTMKVTEQIDALEIMGVNSANFIILPKIIAGLVIFPFLCLYCILIGIMGGWVGATTSGLISSEQFIYGLQFSFKPYYLLYALVKTTVFAYIITSVASYYGYKTEGGAREVGSSSTKAVVNSSLIILIFNLIITKFML